MALSLRLRMIAQQVPVGARLADIGTDHALIPAWLLKEGRIASAIASDLRDGPLERGMEAAEQQGLTAQISFRLSDGLLGIREGEADTIVIAGMGGETIARILDGVPWSRNPELLYLLQPMSSIPELRRWLSHNGFAIAFECIAAEQEKFYVILRVRPGQMEPLSLGEQWAGRQQKGVACPHRAEYLADIIRRRQLALSGMKTAGSVPWEQLETVENTIKELQQMRKEWMSWQQ